MCKLLVLAYWLGTVQLVSTIAEQGVPWELSKPVPGQYACRNLLDQVDPSSNGKLKRKGLMVWSSGGDTQLIFMKLASIEKC